MFVYVSMSVWVFWGVCVLVSWRLWESENIYACESVNMFWP